MRNIFICDLGFYRWHSRIVEFLIICKVAEHIKYFVFFLLFLDWTQLAWLHKVTVMSLLRVNFVNLRKLRIWIPFLRFNFYMVASLWFLRSFIFIWDVLRIISGFFYLMFHLNWNWRASTGKSKLALSRKWRRRSLLVFLSVIGIMVVC